MAKKIDVGGELNSTALDKKLVDAVQVKDGSRGDKTLVKTNEEIEYLLAQEGERQKQFEANEAARQAEADKTEQDRADEAARTEAERQVTFEANEAERQVLYEKVAKNTEGVELLNANTGVSEYPEFSEATAYSVGEVVLYEGLLKRFTSAHEPGVWDGSQVESWSEKKGLTKLGTQVIYDVSADGATFASLSALLSDENLSTLIPTAVRCGGMSIRFVQSSDNKYIQARCMAQSFTTDVTQWQGVDDVPTAGSENLVKSGGILKNQKVFLTGLSNPSGRVYVTLNLIKGVKYRILFHSDIVFNETSSVACIVRNGNIQGTEIARLEDKTARYLDFTSQGETTVAVYLNGQNLTTTFGLIEMQPIDIEKARAEGAETILQGNIDAEETRAKAAEKDIHDDVDPIVDAVSKLDWEPGEYKYTFNGTTSKAVLNSSIVLSQNGDSIEFVVSGAPDDSVNSNVNVTNSFIKGGSTSGVGIAVGKYRVYVRANDGDWIFQRALSGSHTTDDHLWKISFENNDIALYEDGILSTTYEGQKAITLVGLGYRRDGEPLWSGTLKVLKVNNSPVELKDAATLTDVGQTLIPGTGNNSFLSEDEKNLLYNPHQNMYVSKTATEMDIYLKHSSGKYIKYPLNYRYMAFVAETYPAFYDNWGIGKVALCSFDGNSMVEEAKLFYSSETEMTIKLNVGSIVGGAMHGFDNIVVNNNNREFCIVVDNQKVGESEVFSLKPVKKVEVYQTSQVNPPYTNTGVFGTVDKYWLWENGKFTLTAKFTATESIELDHIYSSLLGCYRRWEGNTENNYLTKIAIKNNYPYKVYDITDGWYDSDLVNADKNCTRITAYGDRGIGFSMEVIETNGLANGGMFITTNNNPYNKIYNRVCGSAELSNGDSLFAKTCWEIL